MSDGTERPWRAEYVTHGKGEGDEFHAATIVDAAGNDILQSVTFYSDGSPISAPQFRHSRELIVHCVNGYDTLLAHARGMHTELGMMMLKRAASLAREGKSESEIEKDIKRARSILDTFSQFNKGQENG